MDFIMLPIVIVWLTIVLSSLVLLVKLNSRWPKYLQVVIAMVQLLLFTTIAYRSSLQSSYQVHDAEIQKNLYDDLFNEMQRDIKNNDNGAIKIMVDKYQENINGKPESMNCLASLLNK